MQTNEILNRLRQFDAYPKTLEDFRIKTFGGAAVTIISGILMFILFVNELNYYLTKDVTSELFVDTSRGQKLQINMDITFPKLACAFLSIDAMDVSGEQQIDVAHNLFKTRLNIKGDPIEESSKEGLGDDSVNLASSLNKTLDPKRCESCYGAENVEKQCCNNCDDVRDAYRKKGWAFKDAENVIQCKREGWSEKLKNQQNEGCRVNGYLEVNKVAGNFHFAPGKSFQQSHIHVHDLQAFGGQKFNLTHKIGHLSFGRNYPGLVNPLDSTTFITEESSTMVTYYVKIVPTTYAKTSGKVLVTNQFSVTKHTKLVGGMLGESGLPGVFFTYEFSPMMVKYTERDRSFLHFLTSICAIIGGMFTVAGLVDAVIYHSSKAIQKKIDLGKAS